MKRDEIIDKLRVDEHYYGDFGKQYLSNSDISTLLKNPLALKEPSKTNVHFSSRRLFSHCYIRTKQD